jgi:hypothetical protein
MPDSFSQITTTGYGNRIVNSLKGVVIGLILFVASFGLLYWNEGRVDLSTIAKTATEISSATVSTDPSLRGKLVSTTGVVNSNQVIGDNLFLNPDKFIAAEREVEMYSWKEESESHSQEKFVREARARGMSNDQIHQELLNSGWSNDDITRVLG